MPILNTNKKMHPVFFKETLSDSTQKEEKNQSQFSGNAEKLLLAGRLTASLVHSIRNPLTSIKMRLYSLKRIMLPPDQVDDLEVISEEIGNIENLILDFLGLARPIKLKTEKMSPSNVVDKAIRLIRPDLELRNIQLCLYRPQRLSEILIDDEQLKEALVNLIINGSESLGNQNGSIAIYEKEVTQETFGRSVVIEIHDNGDGIPKSVQNRIFEPFFTTKKEGTGLGLCIAKQFVEDQGGVLTFYSEKNEGSIFTITLPC